jgi:hypothetical protein
MDAGATFTLDFGQESDGYLAPLLRLVSTIGPLSRYEPSVDHSRLSWPHISH